MKIELNEIISEEPKKKRGRPKKIQESTKNATTEKQGGEVSFNTNPFKKLSPKPLPVSSNEIIPHLVDTEPKKPTYEELDDESKKKVDKILLPVKLEVLKTVQDTLNPPIIQKEKKPFFLFRIFNRKKKEKIYPKNNYSGLELLKMKVCPFCNKKLKKIKVKTEKSDTSLEKVFSQTVLCNNCNIKEEVKTTI
jgi:hypothetical protein